MSELRINQNTSDATNPLLIRALVISVVVHLFLYGGYQLGNHYGLWKKDWRPAWLVALEKSLHWIPPAKPLNAKTLQQQQFKQPPQLVFLDVDPAVVTPEPPKNAKYYSSRNSQAANVEATIENAENPNIKGSKSQTGRTTESKSSKSSQLQPSPPKPEQKPVKEPDQPESKPKPAGGKAPGDLAMAKPAEHPGEAETPKTADPGESVTPVHKRPNTLVEAKMREALAGHKMQENGGVKRHLKFDSLDAKATPFGEYDRQLIEAIQNRWFDLLEEKSFSRDRTGRVVLEFNLNADGRITDMKIVENTVDELLAYVCEKAVMDPAPYAPWPADMRRLLDSNQRDIRFTFYYE